MFNLILQNHPSVTAHLYQNNVELTQQSLGFTKGVLLSGTGLDMLDMQVGSSGFRLFCNYDDFKLIKDLRPEELGGYSWEINGVKYSIENVEEFKTNYTNLIKFTLLKNAN